MVNGTFHAMMAAGGVDDLEQVARYAADWVPRVPAGRTVPLSKGIAALADVELRHEPRTGKLVITAQ